MKLLLISALVMVQPDSHVWKKTEAGGMSFEWKIEGEHLHCRMTAPTKGWVAIGFNTIDELTGTNLIMGSVEEEFYRVDDRYIVAPGNHKSIVSLGGKDQIIMKNGKENNGLTIIEFVVPLQTADKYHFNLHPGNEYHLLMAYSEEDDFDHHSRMRTSTKINL